MSANEVLEQVKALPPGERRKFFERVHELEASQQFVATGRSDLARQLLGAGKAWVKPGTDPIADLIRSRKEDDRLDQADEQQ